MKYTPREMAEYVVREGLEGDLLTAIMNLDEYKILPVQGRVKQNEEEKFEFVFDKIGIDLEPYELDDVSEEDALKMMHNHKYVSACLMLYDGKVKVAIDYFEGNDEQREISLFMQVFADMFQNFGIDTKGKLKKFIEKGLAKQARFNEIDRKLTEALGKR